MWILQLGERHLVYTNIKDAFRAAPRSHLGSSDHLSVMLIPAYRSLLIRAKPTVRHARVIGRCDYASDFLLGGVLDSMGVVTRSSHRCVLAHLRVIGERIRGADPRHLAARVSSPFELSYLYGRSRVFVPACAVLCAVPTERALPATGPPSQTKPPCAVLLLVIANKALNGSPESDLCITASNSQCLIFNDNEKDYLMEIIHLGGSLIINISNTKKLIVDISKKKQRVYHPLRISGTKHNKDRRLQRLITESFPSEWQSSNKVSPHMLRQFMNNNEEQDT
ncbi:unnamed protein product, partial [Menidia menidia]